MPEVWKTVGIWVAALLTFCALSFLYKDNPFYKFAESLFVGVSVGYGAAVTFHQVFVQEVWMPIGIGIQTRAWSVVLNRVVPCCLGALLISQLSPKYGWLSRYPLAFVIGAGTGMALPAGVQTYLLPQIYGTVEPVLVYRGIDLDIFATVSRVVLLVGLLSVLAYFFFSKEHKGGYGKFTLIGVYFLMIGFGASFGNTVMARMSLLIGRLQFLITDWLGTMGYRVGG